MRKLEYKENGKRGCTDTLKPILFLRSLNPNETKGNKLHPQMGVMVCVATGARVGSDDIQREAV